MPRWGDVYRHRESGQLMTLESVVSDGEMGAFWWFDDGGYHWQYVPFAHLCPQPVLASHVDEVLLTL